MQRPRISNGPKLASPKGHLNYQLLSQLITEQNRSQRKSVTNLLPEVLLSVSESAFSGPRIQMRNQFKTNMEIVEI